MEKLVEIENLSKSYDGKYQAVKDLNLILPKGKIIGLLGPNGSGKTTLIKMLNGLLLPDKGQIRIGGCAVGPQTKAHVAYLPDKSYLNGNWKVSAVLKYFQDFYKDFSVERALEMLRNLEIEPDARLKTLSKGSLEKVQLILVMSRQADLYVLDEPIAGVDPAARDYILRTIISNYHPGSTILLSTHLIGDIENILDEVIFLRYGQLVLYNSAENIRNEQGKTVDAYFREVFAC